jgi:hypothetical protein
VGAWRGDARIWMLLPVMAGAWRFGRGEIR